MDVSQYLGIFLDESREHIQTLSDQMMILEQEPENQDAISEIFRAAHSLKGMAGTMGYKRLQHLTHVTEDCFSDIRSGSMKVTSELMDVLFQALDAIEGYVNSIQETTDEGEDDNENVVNEINRFHIGAIARAVKEAGATIYNIIPLIPQHDLKDCEAPSCVDLSVARAEAGKHIDVFRHCQHCRADAVGIPGKNNFSKEVYGGLPRVKDTFSHG